MLKRSFVETSPDSLRILLGYKQKVKTTRFKKQNLQIDL